MTKGDSVNPEEALEKLRLGPRQGLMPCYTAELTTAVTMQEWSGQHPVDLNTSQREVPEGTRVVVAMASRFGDVGIRARRYEPDHGYDLRVVPERLRAWEFLGWMP